MSFIRSPFGSKQPVQPAATPAAGNSTGSTAVDAKHALSQRPAPVPAAPNKGLRDRLVTIFTDNAVKPSPPPDDKREVTDADSQRRQVLGNAAFGHVQADADSTLDGLGMHEQMFVELQAMMGDPAVTAELLASKLKLVLRFPDRVGHPVLEWLGNAIRDMHANKCDAIRTALTADTQAQPNDRFAAGRAVLLAGMGDTKTAPSQTERLKAGMKPATEAAAGPVSRATAPHSSLPPARTASKDVPDSTSRRADYKTSARASSEDELDASLFLSSAPRSPSRLPLSTSSHLMTFDSSPRLAPNGTAGRYRQNRSTSASNGDSGQPVSSFHSDPSSKLALRSGRSASVDGHRGRGHNESSQSDAVYWTHQDEDEAVFDSAQAAADAEDPHDHSRRPELTHG